MHDKNVVRLTRHSCSDRHPLNREADGRGPSSSQGQRTEVGGRCHLRYQRLHNRVVLVTAAAYFAAIFLGQKLKLKILCERRLIISLRFFGIPPFCFYALADGIRRVLSHTGPETHSPPPQNLQLELLVAWGS